jgi:hypothetical protein
MEKYIETALQNKMQSNACEFGNIRAGFMFAGYRKVATTTILLSSGYRKITESAAQLSSVTRRVAESAVLSFSAYRKVAERTVLLFSGYRKDIYQFIILTNRSIHGDCFIKTGIA